MFLLLYGKDKSTHRKGVSSQAVGGSLLSTVWWGFSLLSGMQRAIPEGNTATLGSSAVKAQVESSAEKIVFWRWRAACYLGARRHKPWCFFQSAEIYPFSQIVKQWLIAMKFSCSYFSGYFWMLCGVFKRLLLSGCLQRSFNSCFISSICDLSESFFPVTSIISCFTD